MFDEKEIDGSLIGLEPGLHVFQTKSFDCLMEHYRVKDSRLEYEEYTIEDRGDHNAPIGSFERFCGSMTMVPTGAWRDMNFHGWMEFHNAEASYAAKFTDGQLIEVRKVVEAGG